MPFMANPPNDSLVLSSFSECTILTSDGGFYVDRGLPLLYKTFLCAPGVWSDQSVGDQKKQLGVGWPIYQFNNLAPALSPRCCYLLGHGYKNYL